MFLVASTAFGCIQNIIIIIIIIIIIVVVVGLLTALFVRSLRGD
jgi:hypothetical protein|tara:strand:+ start:259 stop:390 length:132 start_codon:yes stop_codon:yes gene_type:complete